MLAFWLKLDSGKCQVFNTGIYFGILDLIDTVSIGTHCLEISDNPDKCHQWHFSQNMRKLFLSFDQFCGMEKDFLILNTMRLLLAF